jgi:acetylornithine aminotransferase
LTVLDVMEQENVPALAATQGKRLVAALLELPGVADVRGLGLLVAAELAPGIEAPAIATACLDAGLVVNAVTPTSLRFAPPLLVTDAELDRGVAILAGVLQEAVA